jgi:broad specificity phosphatase PhoE
VTDDQASGPLDDHGTHGTPRHAGKADADHTDHTDAHHADADAGHTDHTDADAGHTDHADADADYADADYADAYRTDADADRTDADPAHADHGNAGNAGGDDGASNEPETHLVLVRHGHARAVDTGVVAGHRGCTGLSDLGHRQAEALRDRLAAARFEADALVTSVLPRAIETAEIIAPALGADPAGIPHVCDLCERHPGEGDGLTWDAFVERYGSVDPLDDPDRPMSPGGESYNAFGARVAAAITRLTERYAGRTVVVVSHGGVILATTMALLGLGPRWFSHDLRNTSITEWVRAGDGRWLLDRFNDAAHLEALTATASLAPTSTAGGSLRQ